MAQRRSRWRECIEARDAILPVLGLVLRPSELLKRGREIGPALTIPRSKRQCWRERIAVAIH